MTSHRKPIVVGVDGSAAALAAVRWATARAVREGLPLRIVHACALPLGDGPGRNSKEIGTPSVR